MRRRGLREAAFLRKHAAEGVDGVAPVRCCAAVRGIPSLTLSLVFSTYCIPDCHVLTIRQACRHTHRKCGRSGPANCRRRSSLALGQPRLLLPCRRQTHPCTDGAVYCLGDGGIVGGWRERVPNAICPPTRLRWDHHWWSFAAQHVAFSTKAMTD
ncbi:hypothetical protein TcCL_Unassigned01784 [Trypanosoma cruzi]|nr:hypothetical protein TcCL_Unassigned01784 [Trypanosoma cruzi]